MPEDVIDDDISERFGLGPAEVELIRMSNVVLALIPPDGRVSGVFFELRDLANIPTLVEKVRIFRPQDSISEWKSYKEDRVYSIYDISRFVDYPAETWTTCAFIRPRALQLVNNERRRLINLYFGIP